MTNDNQTQNNQENTQKSPENKDNLENPQEQNTVQVPEVEQKELKTSVSTETESAEIMSEKPNTEPLTKSKYYRLLVNGSIYFQKMIFQYLLITISTLC